MILSKLNSPVLLFLFLLASAYSAHGQAAGTGTGSTLDKVKIKSAVRYDTLASGEEAQFAVIMDIKEGWHLNAHNPTLDYLIGVDLSIDASSHAIVSDIQYPRPKQMKFAFAQDVLDVYEGTAVILAKLKTPGDLPSGAYSLTGTLQVQACSDNVCLPPSNVNLEFPLTIGEQTAASVRTELFEELANRKSATLSSGNNQIASVFNQQGTFWAFFSIFLIGLALNLTPCVYPMMSVTVSLFGGQTTRKSPSAVAAFSKALVYVLGIVFMYSTLGVMAAYTGELFGNWLQSPWVLAGIGLLIFLLSLSMFGLFELQPPSWMMQKLGKTQQASGYIGHFLSGLLVGIFAAPCIGPPVIALLAFVGAQGSPLFGFITFLVMALGLGLPYLILGTFSGLLTKMPKSGVWMVWVKKVFGVMLVGIALFYLSLAFTPGYSMYAILVALVFGGVYLGFIERSGHQRQVFRWIKYAAGTGALISAFLLFQNLQKENVKWQAYDSELIEKTDKPIMLDFYADWCIPCIELDRKTFTDGRVIDETESFLRMKVDLTHFDSRRAGELRRKYDIAGVPTILFLDAEGQEIESARVTGFLEADRFLKRVEEAKQTGGDHSE
ncbi:protein-disulfide reductase DsbD family protein [Fodinibius sediminis]|uniref:Thiol:disulfide interchange protein DsbD n=1 Tax=Fodinibius sediminis TaxID=1214077 RepID=A0A521B7W5_9BACT|nr:cytochrome c biogenesis protein CcdA [Fodinibius sediminis]SMO43173.1 Thiol:disulfide interchange protein DsbD [Fodinibius sediminis]